MPLYTYRCLDNGHEFQVRQRMTDDPLTECSVCGGPVRRVVSSVGVVFKGSGFYVTDHRSNNTNGRSSHSSRSKDSADKAESSSSSESSSSTGSQSSATKSAGADSPSS